MKRFLAPLILCILLMGCLDESEHLYQQDGLTLEIVPEQVQTLVSRNSNENVEVPEDSRVEHITIFLFKKDGTLYNRYDQYIDPVPMLNENSHVVYRLRLLLPPAAGDYEVYTICNYPQIKDEVTSLNDLKERLLTLETLEDVSSGLMVMTGKGLVHTSASTKSLIETIKVRRVAAKIDFKVSFQPIDATDDFYLTRIILHNASKKCYLVERDASQDVITSNGVQDSVGAKGDAVHQTLTYPLPADYVQPEGLYLKPVLLNYEPETDKDGKVWQKISCYVYENRRGSKEDKFYFTKVFNNEEIFYPSLKGKLAKEMYPNSTYISVEGIYISHNGNMRELVNYNIYIGKDNWKDFNIRRNENYQITSTIKTIDDVDTRVETTKLNKSKLTPYFESPVDAHYGVGRCFAYTINKDWELYVKDPDLHPWLQISFSKEYKPRLMGEQVSAADYNKYVNTYLESKNTPLSDYFYIHVDEFIPESDEETDNINPATHLNIALDKTKWRRGCIILRDRVNRTVDSIVVMQRPAQFICKKVKKNEYLKYYVAYESEPVVWGFMRYGANPVMTSMMNDRVDGLSNTRKLYQEATKFGGAYNPKNQGGNGYAYSSVEDAARNLPTNHMIGYMTTKNRDRNGNGCIDYNEIEWYVPALDELLELWRVIDAGNLSIEHAPERFYSSTPYLAGYSAEVPGRAWYVKTKKNEKVKAFTMRNRKYYVLCCRRKNAWEGKPDGGTDSGITVDPDWNEDEYDIIPKE